VNQINRANKGYIELKVDGKYKETAGKKLVFTKKLEEARR
jgi:hypothetical protein